MTKRLFDTIRAQKRRWTGNDKAALTQAEVDEINAALGVAPAPAPKPILKPSKAAIDLMHQFEGCRLEAYPDPGSKNGEPWTIGWGSTGPDIRRGTIWTQEQADARFEADLSRFALGVLRLIDPARTAQHEFDALVSFAYNVGLAALRDSTLLRKHNAGDKAGAAEQFGRWRFNDGKKMRGLERRRAAEAALYRGGAR